MVAKQRRKNIGSGLAGRQILVEVLIIISILICLITGWMWWHFIRSSPENVFWGMVNNSLRTSRVNKQTTEEGEGQKVVQKGQIMTSPKQLVIGSSEITQESQQGNIAVSTETIGTPFVDFLRYGKITTTQKNEAGKIPDFSKVVGVWGKSENLDSKQTNGQLYTQAVMGIIPFGALTAAQRSELMKYMLDKKVYTSDFKTTKREIKNNRPVYSYNVSVSPEAYITMRKMYGKMVGLTQFESEKPENYKESPAVQFNLEVDVYAQELISLKPAAGQGQEQFNGYGLLPTKVSLPEKTIPIDELQKRLQSAR